MRPGHHQIGLRVIGPGGKGLPGQSLGPPVVLSLALLVGEALSHLAVQIAGAADRLKMIRIDFESL